MNDTNDKFNVLSLTMWNADGVAMYACNDHAQQPHPFFLDREAKIICSNGEDKLLDQVPFSVVSGLYNQIK